MQFLILALVFATSSAVPPRLYLGEWENFKLSHGREYGDAEGLRYQIFHDNIKKIEKHNALYEAGLETYELGVNQFTDMSEEEFMQYLTLSGPNPLSNETMDEAEYVENVQIPASLDYRKLGAVNSVKNQKHCGSCWAFATTASLEGIYFLKTHKLLSLSEQNLVDCSGINGNHGCHGGFPYGAYRYIRDHGIMQTKDYPYLAQDNQCRFDASKSVLRVSGFTKVAPSNEQQLTEKIATVGPIAVSIDASKWQHYKRGIFTNDDAHRHNHGVTAVGYGDENGAKYYLVRNSWGPHWGEEGYIRIARDRNNQLGIANLACYPNL